MTNPIAIGVPAATGAPFVLDFATTTASRGKIKVAQAKGESLPEGWILDGEGRPSTNPEDFAAGGFLTFAGGHKGSVVSILVTWVHTGSPYVVPSAMSKAGLHAMTKSLAVEWGRYGIRLNAIAPGPFPTEGAAKRLRPGKDSFEDSAKLNPMRRIGRRCRILEAGVGGKTARALACGLEAADQHGLVGPANLYTTDRQLVPYSDLVKHIGVP